jgi:hypothetical protein
MDEILGSNEADLFCDDSPADFSSWLAATSSEAFFGDETFQNIAGHLDRSCEYLGPKLRVLKY